MNRLLQPGMPMPADLRGLGRTGLGSQEVPVPDTIAPAPPPRAPKPAGHPDAVDPRTARRLQVGGILTSAAFGAAGLIASARNQGKLANQLAMLSILAGALVSVSQLFVEEEGY